MRRMCGLFPFALGLCMGTGALADDAAYSELSLGHGRASPSDISPAWTETFIDFSRNFAPGRSLGVRLARHERFGLADTAATISGYAPLDPSNALFVEATTSPAHRFLARHSIQAQVRRDLGAGTGIALGVRETRYNDARATIGEVTLDHYFSDYRVALSILPGRTSIAGSAGSARLSLARYYDRSRLQMMFASGTELDRDRADSPVVAARSRAFVLHGRHALDRSWAIDWALASNRRAGISRKQLDLGIAFRFN
jgi:YaiO family outer membrane protein